MPFPQTIDELRNGGYKFEKHRVCDGPNCQMDIEWWKTPRGKWLPIDVRQDGKVIPHWATCPDRKEFGTK